MALKIIYSLFLALLVALFIGVGISAFYPAPKSPDYPISLQKPSAVTSNGSTVETTEQEAARIQYDTDQKQYSKDYAKYNQNVSIIAVAAAVIVLVISLTLVQSILLISDGLLFGGVLTLLYGIIRGFMSDSNSIRFVVVAVGLVVALIVGYVKFIGPEKGSDRK